MSFWCGLVGWLVGVDFIAIFDLGTIFIFRLLAKLQITPFSFDMFSNSVFNRYSFSIMSFHPIHFIKSTKMTLFWKVRNR